MPKQPAIHSTTQLFLDIYDITNDLLIMKDGAASMILTVSAMNFGLLAEEEQDAIIYAYAGLLNSLNYPIQIVIKSQTKDATKYLNLLKEQEEVAANATKRRAIQHYREFVGNLIHERNVLDKKFYVTIPASSLEMGLLPPQTVVPGVKQIDISTVEKSVILDKANNILEPKRDHLIAQFNRIGLYAQQLTTQDIIQLFYTSYNPEAAEGQQITETSSYTSAVVEAQASPNFSATINPSPASVTSTVGNTPMTDALNNPTPITGDPSGVTPVSSPSITPPVVSPPMGDSPTISAPSAPTNTPMTPPSPTPEAPVVPSSPVMSSPVTTQTPVSSAAPTPTVTTPTPPQPTPGAQTNQTSPLNTPEIITAPVMPPVTPGSDLATPAAVPSATKSPDDPQAVIDSLIKTEPGTPTQTTPGSTTLGVTPSMAVPPSTPPVMGDLPVSGTPTGAAGVSTDSLPPLPEI